MRTRFALVLLACIAVPAVAEEAASVNNILVTATRTERPADEAPGSVTVIEQGRIAEEAGADIARLVGSSAGVRVQTYGGPGSVMSFGMRGAFGPHTLVLMDGRTLNAPGLGMANVSSLSPAFVERVEVVRGPISALYGTGAVGGVVQLVTRDTPEEPISESLFAGGSLSTVRASVLQGASFGDGGGALVGIDAFRTDGHRANSQSEHVELFGKLGFGQVETGRTVFTFGLREGSNGLPGARPASDPGDRTGTQITFGDDDVASLVDRDEMALGSFQADYSLRDFRARASFTTRQERPRQEWLSFNFVTFNNDHIIQSSEFETLRPEAEALNVWRFDGGRILAGASVAYDRFETSTVEENVDESTTTTTGRRDHRTTASAFGQLELGEGAWQGLAGLRWDEPTDYAGRASGRLLGSWRNDSGLRLEAGVGTAFRAPSLNDLNWPADMWSAGNSDLVPETSVEAELSARWTPSNTSRNKVSATVFQKRVDDLIRWFPDDMGVWRPENLDQVDIAGIELGGEVALGRGLSARVAYTFMDATETGERATYVVSNWPLPDDYTYETLKRDLANTPAHQVSLDLDWNLRSAGRGLKLGVTTSWTSEVINYYETWTWDGTFTEADITYEVKALGAGFLLGLRAGWAWSGGEVFAKVDNLLDRDYAVQFGNSLTDRDYPMPGRTVTIGARLNF